MVIAKPIFKLKVQVFTLKSELGYIKSILLDILGRYGNLISKKFLHLTLWKFFKSNIKLLKIKGYHDTKIFKSKKQHDMY